MQVPLTCEQEEQNQRIERGPWVHSGLIFHTLSTDLHKENCLLRTGAKPQREHLWQSSAFAKMPTKVVPESLLRNFPAMLCTNCKVGKRAEPAPGHRARLSSVSTHPSQKSWARGKLPPESRFHVIDYFLMPSSALNINI